MKNKDIVEIILGLVIVIVFSCISYKIGYLEAEKDGIEWTQEKLIELKNNNKH